MNGRSGTRVSAAAAISPVLASSISLTRRSGAPRTLACMQLKIARVCLDCDEVHDAQHCPVCASEAFAYLTRWVAAPERRMRPRPTTSPEADMYRELTAPDVPARSRGQLLKHSALGVMVIAVAGWIWRWNEGRKNRPRVSVTSQSPGPGVNDGGDQTPVHPQSRATSSR